MAKSRKPRRPAPPDAPGRAELVVVAAPDAGLRARGGDLAAARDADASAMREALESVGAQITPLFGPSEDRARSGLAPDRAPDPAEDPGLFYHVEAPEDELASLAETLNELDAVEAAYVKPAGELPVEVAEPPEDVADVDDVEAAPLNDMAPAPDEPPMTTADFTGRQGYLDAAPGGIDARFAWTQAGGRGGGVRVIDLEWGWRFNHEDLRQNQMGVLAGTNSSALRSENHGTAVIGEISGDRNRYGVVGIAPDARIGAVAFSMPTARAIRTAADRLGPGDILLLEIHRAGPRHNFQGREDQRGYVAVEWWPDDYQAIRYAVEKGIIVVEAAGNGRENLDDRIYDRNPASPNGPFPRWWSNPFRRRGLDSGAVVVGAGAPPPGTHGRTHGPDRSRLDFSNYGALVDAQGWGREVTTTGYGDLQGGADRDLWYTDRFSGTSSASPIVVGALTCVQGVLRSRGRALLDPARARELLRATGSPQQDAPGRPRTQRIGNRPDLRQLIPRALRSAARTGVQGRGTIPARSSRRWFTHSWPAHWHVLWTVMSNTPRPGGPQLRLRVRTERSSDRHVTYWLTITNLTDRPVEAEARFAVLS